MHSRNIVGPLVAVAVLVGICASSANAEAPHVVQPGETLWSISASNNLTTRTVAVYNGVSEDYQVVVGKTIMVPTVDEGAAALAAAPAAAPAPADAGSGTSHTVASGESLSSVAAANGITVDALAAANGLASDAYLIEGEAIQVPAATARSSLVPPPGMADIPSPWGPLHLRADAAEAWNAMRDEALRLYGVELQPGGPQSAYRTADQQAELYDLFLSGQGAPADPPGSSSHSRDRGRRRDARDALDHRRDRRPVRLGQGPRAGRVVARGLRRRVTAAPLAGARTGECATTPRDRAEGRLFSAGGQQAALLLQVADEPAAPRARWSSGLHRSSQSSLRASRPLPLPPARRSRRQKRPARRS